MQQEIIDLEIRNEQIHGILYIPDNSSSTIDINSPRTMIFPLIIHVNGMPGTSPEEEKIRFAEQFTALNMAYFCYDHQGVRESTGIFTYFSAQANIEAIIDFLVHHPSIDPTRIGLFGESFGGAMTLCHCARDSRIKSLGVRSPVFDTEIIPTYSFFDDLLKIWTRNKQMRFPPGNHLKQVYISQTAHYNPMKMVRNIHQPMVLIAGGKDELLQVEGFHKLFEKIASTEKKLHVFPKANHNFTYDTDFKQMQTLLFEFFQQHL